MRMSSCRPTLAHPMLALSVAVGALASASPALSRDPGTYEYAQPAADAAVVFHSDPVVQPLAVPAPASEVVTYTVEAIEAPAPVPPLPPAPPVPPFPPTPAYMEPGYAPPPGAYAAPQAYGAAYPAHGYAAPARFDRDAWLDDCRDRVRGVDRNDRARVIGGLLGAVAGGVIGNRVWDSHRLAGTVLGAGVGGLAGVAVGSAIGAANDRRHDDECAIYLDRYVSGGYAGYPGYGYAGSPYPGYGYGYGYTLVPVLVMVPQRRVVRETVTEEWVDEPVRRRTVRPAARPDKRIRYIK